MLISSLLDPGRNWEGGVGNVLNMTRTIYFSWHNSFSELSVYVWSCDCYKFRKRKPQNSLFWNWNLQKRLPGSGGQGIGRLLSILRHFISHCVLRRPALTSDTQHQAIQSTKRINLCSEGLIICKELCILTSRMTNCLAKYSPCDCIPSIKIYCVPRNGSSNHEKEKDYN